MPVPLPRWQPRRAVVAGAVRPPGLADSCAHLPVLRPDPASAPESAGHFVTMQLPIPDRPARRDGLCAVATTSAGPCQTGLRTAARPPPIPVPDGSAQVLWNGQAKAPAHAKAVLSARHPQIQRPAVTVRSKPGDPAPVLRAGRRPAAPQTRRGGARAGPATAGPSDPAHRRNS